MILFALACIVIAVICFRDGRIRSQKIPAVLAAVGVLTLMFAGMGGGAMLANPETASTPVQQGLVLSFSLFGAVWNTLIGVLIGGVAWLVWLTRRRHAKVTHLAVGMIVGAAVVLASPLTGVIADGWNTHGKQLAMIPGAPTDAADSLTSGMLHGSGLFIVLFAVALALGLVLVIAASRGRGRRRGAGPPVDLPHQRRRPAA